MIQYIDAVFHPDFTSARRGDGADVTFTRGETRILACLARHPGRVVTRNQILDEISDVGSDKTDRNVDFMINRLRRKLADSPRTPRFIDTRYGEGYVWLPRVSNGLPKASGAHVVIGPVRGTRNLADAAPLADHFSDAFQTEFTRNFGPDHKVVFDPDCPPLASFSEGAPVISVDMTFLRDDTALDCVIHASAFQSGMTYSLSRHRIPSDPAQRAELPDAINVLARRLAADIWKSLTLTANRRETMQVAMHNAAQNLQAGLPGWAESHRHLQDLAARNPTDHGIQIMLASNIHSKYVQHGLEIFATGADTRAQDEAQIEALVTANLPFVQNDPFYAATAAKLLYFVGPGYRHLALEMVEKVNRTTTAVAPALASLGPMRGFSGQIEPGLAALDQALDLTEPGSEMEVYVLCLKCQLLMAINDRPRLDAVLARLYALKPTICFVYDIFYGREDNPSPQALMAMDNMTVQQARGMLIFADYLCGRHFENPEHRKNTLHVPLTLLARKFGSDIGACVGIDLPVES
ncbi:MAG: winged helix-turn-helix domain-containing protein [Pseudotabrizicola sp.]|uniref:winged helix-turn-helix domain-containing protein n=1 Tax=Pseudotabrizicola sp. TaxID=2939647 RepID=UPI00271F3DC1|nr:winged helix-turn-helix domain-containing protein [Pseudotabrizicola sp.]MDO8883921.1 winged helix-turn-helix domain-containing protein [Pseudotabrizicola sp.]MDP2079387.1 winged helix-turn-helix domain-containing protein [Pseudotabrizicola sp.]MDZ7573597.1 winged helix-turn-helix domain-containing protein [Pseudotabrizicola sp.]